MFFTYEIRKVINRSIGGDAKTQQSRTAGKKIYECNGANKITLPLIMIAERRRSFVQPKCFIFVNSVKHKISLIIWLLPLSTVKQASLWAFFNRVKKIPLDFRQRNIRHSRHLSKARAQRRRGNGSRVTSVFSASGDDFFEGGLPRLTTLKWVVSLS